MRVGFPSRKVRQAHYNNSKTRQGERRGSSGGAHCLQVQPFCSTNFENQKRNWQNKRAMRPSRWCEGQQQAGPRSTSICGLCGSLSLSLRLWLWNHAQSVQPIGPLRRHLEKVRLRRRRAPPKICEKETARAGQCQHLFLFRTPQILVDRKNKASEPVADGARDSCPALTRGLYPPDTFRGECVAERTRWMAGIRRMRRTAGGSVVQQSPHREHRSPKPRSLVFVVFVVGRR